MISRYIITSLCFYTTLCYTACSAENNASTDSQFQKFISKPAKVNYSDFIGSNSCQSCHSSIYKEWKLSTHGKAGGRTNEVDVIAPFDGSPLVFKDVIVTPEIVDGIYQFSTVNNQTKVKTVSVVEAVVGGGFMNGGGTQTFFAKFGDGTFRFLPFDYSNSNKTWFVQLKNNEEWVKITNKISLSDLYNWPPHRVLGEIENISNCQQCHGSQIISSGKPTSYETKFISLAVNCESCHGPAKAHSKTMSSIVDKVINQPVSINIESLGGLTPKESLTLCFQCHAVKTPIKPGFLPGENLEEFYSLKLAILGNENPYAVDGRIKTFGYQQNHLFSDCFLNGTMTCESCHNPHSQNYQDINRNELLNRFDDNQCLSCHIAKKEDISAHTFHPIKSEGSQCISCHMPYRQHEAIGNTIKYTRSDHTVSIPRPNYDMSQGFESACKQCHDDLSESKLQSIAEGWYGKIKPLNPAIANRLKINESTMGGDAADLLLKPKLNHSMAQFENLSYFIKRYLSPGMEYLDKNIVEKLKEYAKSNDLDIKSLALAGLHYSQYKNPEIEEFLYNELNKIESDQEAIRRRWGLILDYFGSVYYLSGDRPKAIECYKLAEKILPDDLTIKENLDRARS